MTGNNYYSDDKNKSSVAIHHESSSYVTNCQICGWYGYPYEKTLVQFEGIRPEDEDGFVEKFTEYNYDIHLEVKGTKHIHKYNRKLIQEYVNLALKMRNGG